MKNATTRGGPFVGFAVIFLLRTTKGWTRLCQGATKKYKRLTYLRRKNIMLK